MLTSPVVELQKEAGATLAEAHGWSLPVTFSSPAEEYQAATAGTALVDRSFVGRLKITGKNALDLLDRLSTNNLQDLTIGQGMYTVLTSAKGRILDLLFISKQDDHLLVLTGPGNQEEVVGWIDFYTFTEDVVVEDITDKTAMLAVTGPKAAELLAELLNGGQYPLPQYATTFATVGGADALVMRTDFAAAPGFDLVVAASDAGALWSSLCGADSGLGTKPVGMKALEAIRVERGVSAFGSELTEEFNPLEANLLDFISFNKGCYIGQEVVARLNTYKKVQRRLVGLSWDGEREPSARTDIFRDGKKVGGVTSVVWSPRLDGWIGMGYVRKAHAKPGVRLTTGSDGDELAARVERLPFG